MTPLRPTTNANITSVLENITITKSVLLIWSKGSSTITEVIPRTQSKLKIFDPTTLPTAISVLPRKAATAEVTSSGSEVPMVRIVRATKDSLPPPQPRGKFRRTFHNPLPTQKQSNGTDNHINNLTGHAPCD